MTKYSIKDLEKYSGIKAHTIRIWEQRFLKRIGVTWRTGEVSTAREHFIYNLIRQKVIVAIDGLPMPGPGAERYMLFLPKSEFSELLILLFTYVLKNRGRQCIYLGVDIPFKDLLQVAQISQPNVLFTFVKAPASKTGTQAYIYELAESFPEKSIFITGNSYFMEELDYPGNVLLIPGLQELILMTGRLVGIREPLVTTKEPPECKLITGLSAF